MQTSTVETPSRASTTALLVLVSLAVATAWPFGSVHPVLVRIVTAVALASSAVIVVGGVPGPPRPALAVCGLVALAVVQLVRVPTGVHAVLAPASSALWYPGEPVAAAALGDGPHPISIDPAATLRWACFVLGLASLAVLAAPALRDRRRALAAAVTVAAGGLAVALYGVVARTLFGARLYGQIAVPTIAPFGPFVSKNHFAGYVEMAALLALGLAVGLADEVRRGRGPLGWTESSRAGRVVLAGGGAVTMALAVLVSLSRGGAVSLGVGTLSLGAYRALVHRGDRRRSALAAALAAVFAVAVAAFAVLPAEGRDRVLSLAGVTTEGSGSFRLGVWRDSVRLAASSPLVGLGFGAFADALPPFKRGAGDMRVEHAENDYLETLAEGGLVGLVLALLAAFLAARGAARGLAAEPDRLRRGLGLGAAAGATALLVHGLFDFNLRITSNAVLFALLAAWVLAAAAPSGGTEEAPRSISRWTWAGALGLALLVTVGGAAPSPPVGRLGALRDARANPTALRLAAAEGVLVARLRGRPGEAEAWLHLAWVRAARGRRDEGAALARHATRLDPQRRSITAGAEALMGLVIEQGSLPPDPPLAPPK